MIQRFVILGDPKPQGRHRAGIISGHVHTYEKAEDKNNKGNIRAQIVQQDPLLIAKGIPVELTLRFHFPRPKAHFSAKGGVKERYKEACHTSKPDLDNLQKAVKDAIKGVIYHDDSQVVSVAAGKEYSDTPRTVVIVRVLRPE